MQDLFKTSVLNQYEAVFCTLHECIVRCPQQNWQAPVANNPYSQSVFHTLFFADLYLGRDKDAQPGQNFHKIHAGIFADYEQMEDRIPRSVYEKDFTLAYLEHCRNKAREVVSGETAEQWRGPSGFPRLEFTRGELHLYNLRHIQHHAAQLILLLRRDSGIDMPWIKSDWTSFR